MLNMEAMKQLKEIENKFKSNGYDAETKKDIEFLLTCYNSLNWDIDSLKEKLEELKPYQFINEICNVCKDYGYSISHQDTQGAFVIKKYDEVYIDWFKNANIDIK